MNKGIADAGGMANDGWAILSRRIEEETNIRRLRNEESKVEIEMELAIHNELYWSRDIEQEKKIIRPLPNS